MPRPRLGRLPVSNSGLSPAANADQTAARASKVFRSHQPVKRRHTIWQRAGKLVVATIPSLFSAGLQRTLRDPQHDHYAYGPTGSLRPSAHVLPCLHHAQGKASPLQLWLPMPDSTPHKGESLSGVRDAR